MLENEVIGSEDGRGRKVAKTKSDVRERSKVVEELREKVRQNSSHENGNNSED